MSAMSTVHAPYPSVLDRHAIALRGTDPRGPLDDLHPLRRVVDGAAVVGIGGSASGTHTRFALKHRVARYLVEELGFRTIVWEESWGSGVVLDRYVRGDGTDARTAVGQARSVLRCQEMLDLVRWMREFNRGRPDWDQVRFLGTDVLELRALQYAELHRFVADVAPARLRRVRELLTMLAMRGTPQEHLAWYRNAISAVERQPLIAAARELDALVRDVADSRAARRGRSAVDPDDAVLHAFALLGFYESGTAAGGDALRDRYAADLVTTWRELTGHRIVHIAADARPAGGLLRSRYGSGYVAVATTVDPPSLLV